MARYEFCKNAKCAKITLSFPGKPDKVLISKAPSLILESNKGAETFSHDMKTPIDKTFDKEITGVEIVEGNWYYSQSSMIVMECPLPGTYPIIHAGGSGVSQADVDAGRVTDMYWQVNQLYCFFDRPDAYFNNRGQCTYKVIFDTDDFSYKFSDRRGVLYEIKVEKEEELPTYKVDCDDCCKDTEILCDHHKFPGYKCYPIPPINSQLANNRYDISRFYK